MLYLLKLHHPYSTKPRQLGSKVSGAAAALIGLKLSRSTGRESWRKCFTAAHRCSSETSKLKTEIPEFGSQLALGEMVCVCVWEGRDSFHFVALRSRQRRSLFDSKITNEGGGPHEKPTLVKKQERKCRGTVAAAPGRLPL